jgi:hypothetical protein
VAINEAGPVIPLAVAQSAALHPWLHNRSNKSGYLPTQTRKSCWGPNGVVASTKRGSTSRQKKRKQLGEKDMEMKMACENNPRDLNCSPAETKTK